MSKKKKARIRETTNDAEAITGKALIKLGWQEGKALGQAIGVAQQLQAGGTPREAVLALLEQVRQSPQEYVSDPVAGTLANELLLQETMPAPGASDGALRDEPLPYRVWGAEGIDPAALQQMNNSMRLP